MKVAGSPFTVEIARPRPGIGGNPVDPDQRTGFDLHHAVLRVFGFERGDRFIKTIAARFADLGATVELDEGELLPIIVVVVNNKRDQRLGGDVAHALHVANVASFRFAIERGDDDRFAVPLDQGIAKRHDRRCAMLVRRRATARRGGWRQKRVRIQLAWRPVIAIVLATEPGSAAGCRPGAASRPARFSRRRRWTSDSKDRWRRGRRAGSDQAGHKARRVWPGRTPPRPDR